MTVAGHTGKLVLVHIGNKYVHNRLFQHPLTPLQVLCLAGRIHSYEGKAMFVLTFFTRILALMGCKLLVANNAAGGSMEGMYNGCLMIIRDHINFYKRNPLAGSL